MPKVGGGGHHSGGRKVDPVWIEVEKISNEDGSSVKARCKHCNSEISARAERIRSHLEKCSKRQIKIETETETEIGQDIGRPGSSLSSSKSWSSWSSSQAGAAAEAYPRPSTSFSPLTLLSECFEEATVGTYSSIGNQPQITEYAATETETSAPSLKHAIDISVAKFFFSNNIPFNAAESRYFVEMMNQTRPGYKPPNHKELAGQLLDEVAEEVEAALQTNLRNQKFVTITLMQDGWSSCKNDPILASSIHTGQNVFLLTSEDSTEERKSSDYCKEAATKSIKLVEEKFNLQVFAVVTDNENAMKKMRRDLEKEYPKIITYGCSAHFMNLLEKEVAPKTVLKPLVEVNNYFRNNHQPRDWLLAKNGEISQTPNTTIWNSQEETVSTYVSNHSKYLEIIAKNPDALNRDIEKILDNFELFHRARYMAKQLAVVTDCLNMLQSDNCGLSEAVEIWKNLLDNEHFGEYKNSIKKRYEDAIHPCHLLANMLDLRYKGQRLTSKEEEIAENWVSEHHEHFLPAVMAFKIEDSDFYPATMFKQNIIDTIKPHKWWLILASKQKEDTENSKLMLDFCHFVSSLLSCPASSAGIERLFSKYGVVWTDLRNKLGYEKAEKLVKINRYLNIEKGNMNP